MSQIDIDELFRRFAILDEELKQLRKEVGEIKWYSQHGTSGAVAYSATTPNKPKNCWVPQWEEGLSDNEKFQEDYK